MDGTARTNLHAPGHATQWCVTIDTRILPHAVVCRVAGAVDADTARVLARALDEALLRTRPGQELQLELDDVALFSAAGLAVLLRLREAAATRRVRLVLVAPSSGVLRVLELTENSGHFTICRVVRPTEVSAALGQALREARKGLEAGVWRPSAADRVVAAALLAQLDWTAPEALPSLPPPHVRADRLGAAVGDLAVAALSTHAELAALLSQCLAALTSHTGPTGDATAADQVPSLAELSDAEGALAWLAAFLQPIATATPARSATGREGQL